MSIAVLPIRSDQTRSGDNEILIGKVNRPEGKGVETEKFGKSGLLIRTTGKKLLITGGTGKGVLESKAHGVN